MLRKPAILGLSLTEETRTWLIGEACVKAKERGYPHELWTLRLLAAYASKYGPRALVSGASPFVAIPYSPLTIGAIIADPKLPHAPCLQSVTISLFKVFVVERQLRRVYAEYANFIHRAGVV